MAKRRRVALPRVWISAVGQAEMAITKQALEALPRVLAQIGAEILALRDQVDRLVAAGQPRPKRRPPATSPATPPIPVQQQSATDDLAGIASF